MATDRIVVATKPTALEELLERHYSRAQSSFYLKSRGSSIEPYLRDHAAYQAALVIVQKALPRDVPHAFVKRADLYSFLFRPTDLVIALGPDGLFVNLAKYLGVQPVIGVNPDPDSINGTVMRHHADQVRNAIAEIAGGTATFDRITLAELRTNDGRQLTAVNDFLIGRRDQVSARYRVGVGKLVERQSSSGILVSTGLGQSGWMASVMSMVNAISGSHGRQTRSMEWDSPSLSFVVREPFLSRQTQANLVFGRIDNTPLVVESEMPEGGYIMSDGMPDDGLEFNAGTTVIVQAASRQAVLVRP